MCVCGEKRLRQQNVSAIRAEQGFHRNQRSERDFSLEVRFQKEDLNHLEQVTTHLNLCAVQAKLEKYPAIGLKILTEPYAPLRQSSR